MVDVSAFEIPSEHPANPKIPRTLQYKGTIIHFFL